MTDADRLHKQDLVLLHGWGVNRGVWQHLQQPLTERVNLRTPDLPGFGLSANFPEPYTLDAVVAQLAEDIPDNSLVCGWSLGGLLAIALAAKFPHKVRRLALIAATPCFLAQDNWPGMAAAVMQQFAESLSRNLPLTIERFLAIQAMGSSSAKADIRQLKEAILAYPPAQPAALSGGLSLLAGQDLRQRFASLRQPVAGCFGRLDSLVPASVVPLLQEMQPTGRFTLLAKASHAPFISHQQEFMDWLLQWLQQ
ncbi:pimeloyl-ACP methyl ester esterase BioH [Chromatiaceae bacterium AAb-1]|nr:pimeloyl-ACP methyl ester esterase BioH [Chromatiaceae bacterium AAb-1]